MKKRLLSAFMALALCLTLLPAPARATETENNIAAQANTANVAEVTVNGSTTTQYTDIDAAFAAAQEADSATVKLLADVTISHDDYSGIALKKGNITLDLNGKTLSKSKRDDNVFYAKNAVFWLLPPEATTKDEFLAALRMPVRLTVQDSSADGNGKIVQPNGGPAVTATLNTILTVNGGTIENASSVDLDDDSHMKPNCAVLLSGGGKAVINGGTLSGMRGVAVTGYITKETEGLYKNNFGIEGYNNDTYGNELTVTGGNICATSGEALIVYEKAKKIELSGGTFTTQSSAHSIWVADTVDGEQTFKGDASSLLASGCRYENNGTECVYSEDGKGVKGNATVALRPANEYAYIDKAGKLTTQANCTEITEHTDDISTPGWYVVKENLTISLLNISGEVDLILCDEATLTVSNYMNVTKGSTLNLFWQSAGSGKLTAAASSVLGTVTAPAGEMKQTTGAGGTTFEKCFEHDWEYTNNGNTHTAMCKLCGKAEAAESHKYDSWAPTNANTHTGTCACGATKTEDHTLTCTPNVDGLTHSTKCSVCGYTAAAESHNFVQTDEYGKKCECGAYLAAEYNGRQYATLTSAIEAAKDGGTVTLQAATVLENITIKDGTNVTIDLNGKIWTLDNMNGAVPVLTVTGGSVTVKNGTLMSGSTSYAATAVEVEGGKLTVGEDMTIQGGMDADRQFPAIDVKGGELTLSEGTELVCGMRVPAGKQLKDYLPAGTAFQQTAYDQEDPTETAEIINGYVQECVGEFTLTVVTHTTHNMTGGACACGLTCAHETVENGVCTVCKQQMKAKTIASNGAEKYYLDLQDAFAGVADGGTVTMLTTLKDDGTISFCNDTDGKPVDKTVTLMMNGNSLSYDGNTSLNIQSGKLIIGDEAVISQPVTVSIPAVWVDNHDQGKDRGTLEFQGKATITGGLLIQNWGKLEGGLKEGTIITSNGTYSVSVERSETYSNVLGLLGDGLAFAKYDKSAENKAGAIVNGNVKQLTEDVIVVKHTHSSKFTQNPDENDLEHTYLYICDCGFVCPHDKFTNSICDICHTACTHDEYDSDETCARCHAPFAVRVEHRNNMGLGSYELYMKTTAQDGTDNTLQQVFNKAESGSTVTLLVDGLRASGTVTDKTIKLNLDGKSLIEGNGLVVTKNDENSAQGKLIVTGSGSNTTPENAGSNICMFRVQDGGELLFDNAFSGSYGTIYVEGGTLTLLNNVNLVTQVYVNSNTFTLDLNGHTLTSADFNTMVVKGGSMTIRDSKGNGVISNTSSDNIAVFCYGGNVTILGGSFPSKLHWEESGTVSLQGGAFRSLDRTDGSWLSAIPEGKALERDGQITDASAKTIIAPTGFYVLADHKEHTWENGKCACGREHTDHTWEDGKCTVCHLTCSHHEIGEDGMCKTCGTQFTAKENGDYYKHLSDALASESVDDVTLVADDTLSEDVTLIKDIFFYPNGHTVSGEGAIVVPSGKRLELREKNETEKAGNAGAIRVENGGLLVVGEDFTGTVQTLTVSEKAEVKLLGGTYGTITGSREKAGTLLYGGNDALAFKKQDGSFVRYDQRIPSETPLENVTVAFCPHKQLTEACGETCEYCDGALRCRIGASGYRDTSAAIHDVPDGGTITLLRDYSAVTNISANVDRAYTIDLNGHSVRKDSGGISLAVYAGTPKIIDSKGGGVIAGLEIDSKLGLTLADLLPEGWDFQKSDRSWLSTTELKGKTASNVTVAQLPIQSMNYPTEMSMTYGGTGMLQVKVAKEPGAGAVTFQWYKVEDGQEKAVGSATTKNQFNLAEQKLSAGKHIFRFSATCDGYKKMSQDIVVTVQKADIRSGLITPPTARENLTYTGQAQALITAGSVTSGGTMQYSLTENGTYSPDIPVGTDAGAYTVWYRVIGDANHNDTVPASVAVSIGKKPLTITGVTAASKPYDGTTNADISSVTFEGSVTLQKDKDYAVTARFDDASAGNVKNITATVTLMEQTAKNYALEQSSFNTTGNITKAAAPDFTKETALVIVNGHEKTYTVTLPALPKLETPKEYGALTYELGEIKLNDGYYTSGAKVENGALTLPIQKNDVKTTGSVGTVTVVIKSTNYEDITLTVNVNATNKLVPTGAPTLSKTTLAWGEQLSTIALSGTMTDPTDSTKTVKGKFEWVTPGAAKEKIGEYEAAWKFTPDENAVYTEAAGTVTITVTKATPTGAPGYTKITTGGKTLKDANLTVGTIQPEGTIQWELGDTTVVTANTAYKWAFTPDDQEHYNELTGSITLYSVSGSSGGGGGSDSNPVIKTETKNNADGSTTKTETKKDGTVIETTTGKDGSVSKTETRKDGSSVTENKAADGSTGTVKTDKNGQTEAKTALSNKAIEDAKKNGEAVKAPVEVKASRNSSTAPTVKVELPKGTGETKVEIPVSNVKPGTVAVLVHPDGTEEIVKNSVPTENGIQLTVDGSATVKIVDNSKDFIDTRNHWAKDAIDFVSARGLVNGMSATIYAPNNSTTRAQLWTILARQNDADLNGGSVWYEKAQLWSKDKGISDGTEPNAAINRAQMVTMLWRTMGQPAAGGAATFTDVPADSYYASAVAWAVENGITTGVGGGRFDPNSTCTRAQIATFLYRYMK